MSAFLTRLRAFLNTPGSKRSLVNLLIVAGYFVVSWATVGTLYGERGLQGGDDWYIIANTALGQFPACTGVANFSNPWRPFHPTLHCLLYTLVGPNLLFLFTLNVLIYTATAFAWYGIVRNVFGISRWWAFTIGLVFLTYPDDLGRLRLVTGMSLAGTMVILYALWAVLTYWDHPRAFWRLGVGCLLTVYGLLAYETLFAVWAVGLPLALLYKSRQDKNHRFFRRWLWTTFVTELVGVGYLLWRFLILPTTYNDNTVITGAHAMRLDPGSILRQVGDSFLLTVYTWVRNWHTLLDDRYASGNTHDLPILALGVGLGLVILLTMVIVYRIDRPELERLPGRGRDLLLGMPLLVIFTGMPFYIIQLDLLSDYDHSFGTPFAVSVGIIGLLLIILPRRALASVAMVVVSGLVVFNGVFTGYHTLDAQTQARYGCDFFVRFTDVVERLPPDVYVIMTAARDRVLPDYFGDAYRLTSYHTALYFEGPFTPDSYDVGHFGYMGYLIFPDSWAELTPDGVKVFWPPWVTDYFHVRSALPKLAPLDQTIFVKYDPFHALTILSAPEGLAGLVIRPEGGAVSRASSLARRVCDWDPAIRETIQQLDQASQGPPTAAALCHDEGVTVYKLNGKDRVTAFELNKDELNRVPLHPPANTLIGQGENIRLYRLTSGELQLNAPPSSAEQGEYVFRWNSCSR